ncbi:MAG: bifunctional riboflavin kinase/FMN adenylyltransferase [Actinomycetaceae bacterium]|nr:bifunctional riboflavin kinase/FMN adenylyltransferase [Actinomycetaceae bacterium]MDY6082998.1 bifunctional riboflavin kinase/FMN adenylyltransferase [Actinomycetaceae bacterium]
MEIWHKSSDVPANIASVATVGVFDGVHRGHQAVLRATIEAARRTGSTAVALTFDPNPVRVHHPNSPFQEVASLDVRLALMARLGLDAVYVQHYTEDYARARPQGFIRTQLLENLGARAIVLGSDSRFGAGNQGDVQLLKQMADHEGFDAVIVDDLLSEDGQRWSSTWVRRDLSVGDVRSASRTLGHFHRLTGRVHHGYQRGRALGFPTANVVGDQMGEVPADGVYAGWLQRFSLGRIPDFPPGWDGAHYHPGVVELLVADPLQTLPAAISIGSNPQFGGVQRTVEAHVLGRSDLNLYGEFVALDLVDRIRPMEKFANVEELLERMDQDLLDVSAVLGVPPATRQDPHAVTAQ